MQETWVWSLGWEDPLEKEMATHSCTLAWKIPWTKEHGGLQSTGSQRVGQDWATSLSLVKTYLDYMDLCNAMSLIYNMLFIFVIAFLTRSKHLLLSWLQWPSAVISELKKIKSMTGSTFSSSICNEVMRTDAVMLSFNMLKHTEFQPSFSTALSPSSRGSLVPLYFLPLKQYHLHIWGCWYVSLQSWFQLVIHPVWHFSWYILQRSWISRVTIYSLVVLLPQFWSSMLFHVWFCYFFSCI